MDLISMDNNKICSDMFHPLLRSSGSVLQVTLVLQFLFLKVLVIIDIDKSPRY